MTYDFHGKWESRTGHNSPLYPRQDEQGSARQLNMVRARPFGMVGEICVRSISFASAPPFTIQKWLGRLFQKSGGVCACVIETLLHYFSE